MTARIKLPHAVSAEIQPWLDSMALRNLSPQTIQQFRHILSQFVKDIVGGEIRSLRDVSPPRYEAWQHVLLRSGLKPRSCENRIRPVRLFYKWAEARGLIFADPTKETVMPRFVRPLQHVPTEAQMATLLASISSDASHKGRRDHALLEVAYATGFRLGELTRMNVDSVDLDLRLARILGKGAKERVVPLTASATEALRLYLKQTRRVLLGSRPDDGALWVSLRYGPRLHELSACRMICRRGKAAGVKLSPQAIRRAFASHLLRHGASIYHLKKFLGHATFKHLKQYARYAPEDLKAIHARSHPAR